MNRDLSYGPWTVLDPQTIVQSDDNALNVHRPMKFARSTQEFVSGCSEVFQNMHRLCAWDSEASELWSNGSADMEWPTGKYEVRKKTNSTATYKDWGTLDISNKDQRHPGKIDYAGENGKL